jgi:hypothetical protein
MINNKFILEEHNENSDLLIVVFSSANVPVGKFTGSHIFSGMANILYVNTQDNDWYLRGVGYLGNDYFESELIFFSYLDEFIKKSNIKHTVFFGSSMGAYAALLYGSRYRAELIISLSPEVILGVDGGYFNKEKKIEIDNISHPDLIKSISEKSESRIICICGDGNIVDLYCANKLLDLNNVELISIRNSEHVVVKEIEQEIGIFNFIYSELFNPRSITTKLKNSNIVNDTHLIKSLYNFDIYQNESDLIKIDISKIPTQSKDQIYRRLALYYSNIDNVLALNFASLAYLLNPRCGKCAIIYSRELFKLGKYNEVLFILIPIISEANVDFGKPFIQAFEIFSKISLMIDININIINIVIDKIENLDISIIRKNKILNNIRRHTL